MLQQIVDLECGKCHKTYKSSSDDTLKILYRHCFLSICPTCTDEVVALMGYTKERITKDLGLIKEAETENNRKRRLEDGTVCRGCENRFAEGDPRVRKSNASNVESWHLNCYDKNIA